MPEAENELAKLRRRFAIVNLILVVTLLIGAGTTLATLYSLTSFGAVRGPLAYTVVTASVSTTSAIVTQTYATTTLTIANQTFFTATPSEGYGPASLAVAQVSPESYGYMALFSWAVFAGALIWRGHIRSVWSRSRFSYDTFRLLVRMRGAQTRLKLMHSLNGPRNKLQLATSLGIDWKAVDKHVQVLEEKGLIYASMTSGTATFYELTDKGRRALEVLEELGTTES